MTSRGSGASSARIAKGRGDSSAVFASTFAVGRRNVTKAVADGAKPSSPPRTSLWRGRAPQHT